MTRRKAQKKKSRTKAVVTGVRLPKSTNKFLGVQTAKEYLTLRGNIDEEGNFKI